MKKAVVVDKNYGSVTLQDLAELQDAYDALKSEIPAEVPAE